MSSAGIADGDIDASGDEADEPDEADDDAPEEDEGDGRPRRSGW